MGYDLHITRARDWTQSESAPITDAEWRAHIAADPELRLTGAAETSTPDGTLRYESAGLAVWTRHPGGGEVWFDFRHGAIVVKNPDEPTIAKMIAIAAAFGARVIGDDGEVYRSPGETPIQPPVPLSARISSWVRGLRPVKPVEPAVLPFTIGDRVRDPWGAEATIVAIDLEANHRLGSVVVKFDDGRELSFAAHGHGLTLIDAGGSAAR